jgi:uncharacterized protein with von Willebrand factor type A (vWA) domain
MESDKLSDYPYVVVRIGCSLWGRSGQYRLAQLAARYGGEVSLDDLLEKLALDCQWPGSREAAAAAEVQVDRGQKG